MPYFDYNATAPLAPVAREALLQTYDEAWQNPSSPYREAARVRLRLDRARDQLGQFLNCKPAQLVFNSGATEAADDVFQYWAETLPAGARVALNRTEHPSVLAAARRHFGERSLILEINEGGVVDLGALERLLASVSTGTLAVAVMAANNETGVLQPWTQVAQLCRERRVPFVCDATQWAGKLPMDGFGALGWVFASAHKFGGPKGVGFLKIPEGAESFHGQEGGEQEQGHRAGTENFPGVAAMVAALAEAEQKKLFLETQRLAWRTQFERALPAAVPAITIVAEKSERLWNTVSLLMPHTENHRWVARLDKLGLQVSTGSACATGKKGPSHVLAALGLSAEEAKRVLRVSAGWETTEADWQALAAGFAQAERELRATTSPAVVQL